jgi:hypothetical protein
MEQSLTQEQFIEIVGEKSYINFSKEIYDIIKSSDAYKELDDAVFYIGATPLNETVWFHYEATLNKIGIADDFGFTKMVVTDDLDFTLDRINDAKREINKNK